MTGRCHSILILVVSMAMVCARGQALQGYLQPPQYYQNGFGGAISTSIADLNQDGLDDIVSSNANVWEILLTTSSGQIGTPLVSMFMLPCFPACPAPILICSVIGDFNRDGFADLMFTNGNYVESPVFTGSGTGQFTYQTTITLPHVTVIGTRAVDIDLDGYPEIIGHSLGGTFTPDSVLHVVSTAGGTYTHTMQYATGRLLILPDFADLTGDGRPDLVSAAFPIPYPTGGPGYVFVQQGLGSNSAFGQSWMIPLPPVPIAHPGNTSYFLTTADLDGNGIVDLIINISDFVDQTSTISTCLNPLTTATWWTMPSPGFISWPGGPFYAADVDGDGRKDLLGAEPYFTYTGTPPFYQNVVYRGQLSYAIGNGDGTFRTPVSVEIAPSLIGMTVAATAVGDFDGDRDPDLLFTHQINGQLGVAWNRSRFGRPTGGGGFYLPVISAGIPTSGNAQFSVSVSGVPASAPALLGLSLGASQPNSMILIDFSPQNLILPTGPFGITATDSSGQASLPIPIPANPALIGTVVFGQWGVADPQTAGGIVLSGGATFIIR